MANKAIFFDRDQTLIEDLGYINHPDQVKLLDGVPEAIIELRTMGYKLIVVSNQSGVARGIVTEEALGEIHERLKQLLAEKGAHLDRIYYCPYHPDGVVPKYRKDTNCRKPNPGMLLAAANEMDIDLSQCWMIGNDSRDIEAGLRAGCKTILIHYSSQNRPLDFTKPRPDYEAVNIKEAVNIVKKHQRSSRQQLSQDPPAPTSQRQPPSQITANPPQPEFTAPPTISPEQNIPGGRIEQLLTSILEQLKGIQRGSMFDEFSIMRLMAGLVQIVVLFCLLISIWFLLSPTRQDLSVLITLGFAAVLQLMALTFYIMQKRQ